MLDDVVNIEERVEQRLDHYERQLRPSQVIVGEFRLRVVDDVRDPVKIAEDDASQDQGFAGLEASALKLEYGLHVVDFFKF